MKPWRLTITIQSRVWESILSEDECAWVLMRLPGDKLEAGVSVRGLPMYAYRQYGVLITLARLHR